MQQQWHQLDDMQICIYTVSQKTSHLLTCYNLDTHDLITIIFGRSVTEKIRNQTMLCFPTLPIYCFSITLRKRKPRRQRTGALCVQHSPTAAALSTCFLLNHAANSPELNALITRFRESYSSVWVVSQKDWRNQAATDWILAMHYYSIWVKNAIFVFPCFARQCRSTSYLRWRSKVSFNCLLYR